MNASRPESAHWRQGILGALLSPIFLGIVPILAKLAYAVGVDVLTVVVGRTLIAALALWLGALLFARHYIISSTPAILGSLLAGGINGVGSLFFYGSLTRIDASLGQLINITYLIFVTLLLRLAGQAISWLTFLRTILAIGAVYLLTLGGLGAPDWPGIGMMFIAAITFAVQLVLSQRIMLDIPAPTMALYAMTAMAIVVIMVWLLFPTDLVLTNKTGWPIIFGMGLVTALSRLTLFLGVKALGSIQTALLSLLEIIVTIVLSMMWLQERLTAVQWLGAAVLTGAVLLVRFEKGIPHFIDWQRFIWQRHVRGRK